MDAYQRVVAGFAARRDERSDRIEQALARLGGEGRTPSQRVSTDVKLRYAVLHHALYGANQAAQSRDLAQAGEALMLANASVDPFAINCGEAGRILVAESDRCRELRDTNFEMPSFLLTQDALDRTSRSKAQLLQGSLDALRTTAYGSWVNDALAVVVLLHERPVREGTSSWTLTPLPYTVFTDFYLDAHLFAKDVLHESGHAWLNDALAANNEELPPGHDYFSPWKKRNRPAMAMLHSSLSFSLVTNYLTRALEQLPLSHDARVYATARVVDERRRLGAARDNIKRTLTLLQTPDIADVIETELEIALAG